MFSADEDTELPRGVLLVAATWLGVAGFAVPADAQETREEEIAKKQAEKAKTAAPYVPNKFEAVMGRIESAFASPPSGFYPAFGSVYPGGGFRPASATAISTAARRSGTSFGLYSIKNYKKIEVGTRTPWNVQGPVFFGVRAGWLDAPEVGLLRSRPGHACPMIGRTSGRSRGIGGLTLPSVRRLVHASAATWPTKTSRRKEGAGSAIRRLKRSIDRRPARRAGTRTRRTFIPRRRPRSTGGHRPGTRARAAIYGVTFHDYTDLDDTFSFRRVDGEIIQHLPILRENWVISLRGRVQTTLDDNDIVPYYLMPYLGQRQHAARLLRPGVFAIGTALLTSAEFRWIPNRIGLDMAIFYDAGKVAGRA